MHAGMLLAVSVTFGMRIRSQDAAEPEHRVVLDKGQERFMLCLFAFSIFVVPEFLERY